MADQETKQRSAFYQAFTDMKLSYKQWVPTALWLFVAHALLNLMSTKPDLNFALYLQGHPHPTAKDMADLQQVLMPCFWAFLPRILLDFVAMYIFGVFFWGVSPIERKPTMSLGNFAAYLGRYIQVVIIIEGLALLSGLVVILPALALRHLYPGNPWVARGSVILMVGVLIITLLYWSLRYMFSVALTINQVVKPLKTSLVLSRGKVWNIFCQALTSFAFFAPLAAALFVSARLAGLVDLASPDRLYVDGVERVWVSAIMILQDVCVAAFMCAIVRYFYKKKREAEPRFSLTFPSNLIG